MTTGYWGSSVAAAERRVFGYSRRHWYANNRSAKTYIKEFNEAFFHYTVEVDPAAIRNRNMNGETTWFGEPPYTDEEGVPAGYEPRESWKKRLVRRVKPFIPKPIKEFMKKCIHA